TDFGARGLAVSPDGHYVYVTSTLAGGTLAGQVTVFDATNNYSVATTITGNGLTNPYGVAFSSDGQTVYVVNQFDPVVASQGTLTVLGM
ncbi:MAG: YncE family protein, partial [Mycobacterium sp.]